MLLEERKLTNDVAQGIPASDWHEDPASASSPPTPDRMQITLRVPNASSVLVEAKRVDDEPGTGDQRWWVEPDYEYVVVITHGNASVPTSQLNVRTSDFLERVYSLCSSGQERRAADLIVEHMDNLLNKSKFGECDCVFGRADPAKLSDSAIVSLLGITLAAKRLLKWRRVFYQNALQAVAIRRGLNGAERLLTKYR